MKGGFWRPDQPDATAGLWRDEGKSKVLCTGILKISVVTDKREYRIYRKFIGDRNKISEEI
jgi:hypothetical protein